MIAHTFPSNDSIVLAGGTIPLGEVTWVSGASASQVQQMKQLGIGGVMGNRIFLDKVLVLDTRRQKFGIIMSKR